jgi:hypothetical protein
MKYNKQHTQSSYKTCIELIRKFVHSTTTLTHSVLRKVIKHNMHVPFFSATLIRIFSL